MVAINTDAWPGVPRSGHRLRLLTVGVVVGVFLANVIVAAITVLRIAEEPGAAVDWYLFVEAGERIHRGGDPYLTDNGVQAYRWSPVAAYLLGVIAPIGLLAWRLLHFAALLALRDWRLILLVLVSWPFWDDVKGGNVMTFVVVAGFLALRGSRLGEAGYVALTMLAPRPLMLPLLAWLVWKRPSARWLTLLIGLAHLALVAWAGLGDEWLARLLATASEIDRDVNFAPSQWVGWWWTPVGLALAAWLTVRGRVGLAGLAASPYWFGYYLLFLVLEAPQAKQRDGSV